MAQIIGTSAWCAARRILHARCFEATTQRKKPGCAIRGLANSRILALALMKRIVQRLHERFGTGCSAKLRATPSDDIPS